MGDHNNWQRRSRAQRDMLYGLHPIEEALNAGQELERIIMRSGLAGEGVTTIQKTARQRGIPVQTVPAAWFARLGTRNHQGLVAYRSPISYTRLDQLVPMLYEQGTDPLIVAADGITDVHNLGAIARTAECVGAHCLLVPSHGSAQISADTVRTSAGALEHLPIARTGELTATLRFLQDSGIRLVAATEKGGHVFSQTDLKGPLCLIMGDEGRGVSPATLAIVDEQLRIPIHGAIESLNVSVAAGIILYEVERQRHRAPRETSHPAQGLNAEKE